jgi:hypothetical protein
MSRISLPTYPAVVRAFIEAEQSDAYGRLARILKLGNPSAAFDLLHASETLLEEYRDVEPPTRYESVTDYALMHIALSGLSDAWRIGSKHEGAAPHLATLPTGDVNARAVTDPDSQSPVIFFEQGLIRYLYNFAQLVAWAIPPLSWEQLSDDKALTQLVRRYTMPPAASGSFVKALYTYVSSGAVRSATQSIIPQPKHNIPVAATIVSLMERFVMAHELAHVACGHLPLKQAPEHEFEADIYALSTMVAVAQARGQYCAVSLWACDLALTSFHILNRAIGTLAFGGNKLKWMSNTHPDDLARRHHLRAGMNHFREYIPDSIAAVRELLGMTDFLLGRLWEFAEVSLTIGHAQKDRPSPLWKMRTDYYFQPA